MYARLITQCQKDQEDAIILFDQRYHCPAKQKLIRSKLVPEEAIDREYAAEKSAEDALDVDSEDDDSPNLDDPEVVGNFMDDFQA